DQFPLLRPRSASRATILANSPGLVGRVAGCGNAPAGGSPARGGPDPGAGMLGSMGSAPAGGAPGRPPCRVGPGIPEGMGMAPGGGPPTVPRWYGFPVTGGPAAARSEILGNWPVLWPMRAVTRGLTK